MVIDAVGAAAAEVDCTPAQVALAWVASRSPVVHPILGARTADQLADCLGYLDNPLPGEIIDGLTTASAFERGFPLDFIDANESWVLGAAADLDIGPTHH